MSEPNGIIFEAASFAARAHKSQLRKDNHTPYIAHPFRVCLVVRQIFGFDDPKMLAAAILHDTIEDTTTDFDDIHERFGPVVARWVVALTKDMRLENHIREEEYAKVLGAADWQAKVLKLADIYDNAGDCRTFSVNGRRNTLKKSRFYLDAMRAGIPPEAQHVVKLVEARLAELEASLTS